MDDKNNLLFYRKSLNPCKDCTERTIGCHGKCEKYAEWVKKENAISDKIATAKTRRNEIEGYFEKKKKRLDRLSKRRPR